MRARRSLAVLSVAVLIAAIAACGGGGLDGTSRAGTRTDPPADQGPRSFLPPQVVEPALCPTGHPGCREAEGRILYVERHDPDGDGDAHFVILDPQGITFRGITAVDVEAGLRPSPLPGAGDLISAAGPVQVGSFGQEQIHALVLHVGVPSSRGG